MRFTPVVLFATLTSMASAQGLLDNLPPCARSCVGSNFGGCNILDIKCICSNSNLISGLSCCVSSACSPSDQQKTIDFASSLCKTYNIIVPTVASCATTASSTGGASASQLASAASNTTSSASPAVLSAVSITSARSTATSASVQAASSGAAGHNIGSGVGVGLAVAGFLAAL
ncbi:hypothetical protein K432DRAFT_432444 [Lepidopterella palustris CBS 459.81]|uniref:CFEM domain-containing protein n=1 Tax=Lepidopterella palustris CBS 459.81 TaxID=1314670 RepID=A0A8E2EHK9_9PEZI|nr:hypothetical protein K432DRAFT_432444 [Lepidopterella palustris CBS 459.81]